MLRFALLLLGGILVAVPTSSAEETMAPIVVTASPLGKFGFGTGTGGPIWRSTIGHLVINAIEKGGPADKAGLHQGDEILSVDGLTVPGRARKEVFAALRSKPANTVVSFTVAPEDGSAPPRTVRVRTAIKP